MLLFVLYALQNTKDEAVLVSAITSFKRCPCTDSGGNGARVSHNNPVSQPRVIFVYTGATSLIRIEILNTNSILSPGVPFRFMMQS